MSRNHTSQQALLLMVGCVVVSALVSLAAVLIALQRPVVVVVHQGAAAAGPVDAEREALASLAPPPPPAAAAADPGPAAEAPPAATGVASLRREVAPRVDNVFDAAWNDIAAADLPLLPQQVAPPMLDAPSVKNLRVQAVHDGDRMVWRLSWEAPTPAATVDTGAFTDAVAVQVPLAEGAPFTMGAQGKPVGLLQWKALWQMDIDEGFRDVHVLYPHAFSDLYWFAEGAWPFPIEEAFQRPEAREWLVGVAAGSPMAKLDRTEPVEEMVAEGFGSTTFVADSASRARGEWRDGRWTVVIERPLDPSDPWADALRPGHEGQVAFAVWDGHGGNVGGRKHYVGWIPFRIEP